jgi:endopeptidase La
MKLYVVYINIIFILKKWIILINDFFSYIIIMMIITIGEYKLKCLLDYYDIYSSIINNEYIHIDRCYTENLIGINERNKYLDIINKLLHDFNNSYNKNTIKIHENVNFSKKIKNILSISSLLEMIYINNLLNKEIESELYFEPFQDIKIKFIELVEKIGINNLNDLMKLAIGIKYKILFTPEDLIIFNLLIKKFIPMNFKIKKNNIKSDEVGSSRIKVKKIKTEYDILLDNYCEITININNTDITLKGYFQIDNLFITIRTSQLCNDTIFKKKKKLEISLREINHIPDDFKSIFVKNLNILDILSNNIQTFKKDVEIKYNIFTRLSRISKVSFKNVVNEFIKDTDNNILKMYETIKLLLYGDDSNINTANLLFGMTKDKKIGSTVVSNIIYKNLSYIQQIRLKKSSTNIKNELEKIQELSSDTIDLKKQLAIHSHIPPYIKRILIEKIEEMKSSNSEFYKQQTYVKVLMNYPWPSPEDNNFFINLKKNVTHCKDFLENSSKKLNELVYGHNECKSIIQELIGKWISKPDGKGKVLGLVGPPGVGKTMIAKGLGEALSIPFVQINIGGLDDACVLCGHSYTYSGAQPGLIVRKMVEAGNARCIIYFDELDKVCKKHDVNEIHNVFIHLTDPNTNSEFHDKFFQEVTFPIDKALIVFSYNDSEKIDKILRDRIHEVNISLYSINDKLIIVKDFLLKEICDGIGFDHESIYISDENIKIIIDDYTLEAGVRSLKRKLESIFLKLNIDKIYQRNMFKDNKEYCKENKLEITKEIINKFLKKQTLNIRYVEKYNSIGIINGMYATTVGYGGIMPIQIFRNFVNNNNDFILKITGSQGKVMQESIQYAFNTSINILKPEIIKECLNKYKQGLHIHTPDGATPKDGPSAGAAFTTCFVSRLLDLYIRADVAITGEIDLTGNVTKIGGLMCKLSGAKKAGVKLAIIPQENEDDYKEIINEKLPNLIEKNIFEVKLVSHISEILKIVLVDENNSNIKILDYIQLESNLNLCDNLKNKLLH